MSGKALLSDLGRGKLRGLHTSIEDFLAPAKDPKTTYLSVDQLTEYGAYAIKFLSAYKAKFDLIEVDEVAGVIRMVDLCYRCSSICVVREPLQRQMLIYSISLKAVNKGYFCHVANLLLLLLSDLTTLQKEVREVPAQAKKISDMSHGLYATLWNAAIKGSNSQNTDTSSNGDFTSASGMTAYQRFLALAFYWLGVGDGKVLTEQLAVTLCHYKAGVDHDAVVPVVCILIKTGLHCLRNNITDHEDCKDDASTENMLGNLFAFTAMVIKLPSHFHPHCFDLQDVDKLFKTIPRSCDSSNIKLCWNFANEVFKLFQEIPKLLVIVNKNHPTSNSREGQDHESLQGHVKNVIERSNKLPPLFSKLEVGCRIILSGIKESCQAYLKRFSQTEKLADHRNAYLLKLCLHDMVIACLEDDLKTSSGSSRGSAEMDSTTVPLVAELTKKSSILLSILQSGGTEEDFVTAVTLSQEAPAIVSHCLSVTNKKISHLTGHVAYLASDFSNLGRHFLLKEDLSTAADFMRTASSIFHQILTRSADVSPELKQKIWRRDDIFVSTLFKNGRSEEALQMTAVCLLANPAQVSEAMETWIKLKTKLHNSTPGSKLLPRTMAACCHSVVKSGKAASLSIPPETLLYKELSAWKRSRHVVESCQLAVIEQLLSLTSLSPADKASLMLSKAQVIWATNGPIDSVKSAIEVSLRLLFPQESDSSSTRTAVCLTLEDDRAQSLLWSYMISMPRLSQINEKLTNKKIESSLTESGVSDLDVFTEGCDTISSEETRHKPLCDAVSHWRDMLSVTAVSVTEKMRCSETSLHAMVTASSLCKLSYRMKEALQILDVAMEVAKATKNSHYHLLTAKITMEILIRLRQPLSALCIAATVAEPVLPSNPGKKVFTECEFLLQKCQAYLMANQFEEAFSVHKTISAFTQSLGSKMKVKEGVLLNAQLKCLQYHLMGQMWSCDSKTLSHDSCGSCDLEGLPGFEGRLECLKRAVRDAWGVMLIMLGDKDKKSTDVNAASYTSTDSSSISELWSRVDLLLTVLLLAGRAFLHVGDSREAQCCLLEGTKVSLAFLLPRRAAEFYLALAELDHFAEAWGKCDAHLHRVHYAILSDYKTKTASSECTLSKESGKERLSSYNKCFGFESSDDDDDDDDGYKLHAKSWKDDDDESDDETSRPETGASPSAAKKRQKLTWPKYWTHPKRCQCASCGDVLLHKLLVKYFHLQGILSSNVSEDKQLAIHSANEFMNRMVDKLKMLQENVLSYISNGTSPKQDEMVYQDEIFGLYMSLLEMQVNCTATVMPDLASDISFVSTYCSIPEPYARQAEMAYLRAVKLIPWPERSETRTDIQKLTDAIGNLNIDRSRVENFQTPFHKRPPKVLDKKPQKHADDSPLDIVDEIEISPIRDVTTSEINIPDRTKENAPSKVTKKISGKSKENQKWESKTASAPFKTPARKTRVRKTKTVGAVNNDVDNFEFLANNFKTPMSVASSRRRALDLLINSDDENDADQKPKQGKSRTATSRRGKASTKVSTRKIMPTETECNDGTPTKPMSAPVASLFKEATSDQLSAYEFPDSPRVTSKPQRGRRQGIVGGVKKPGPKRRGRHAESVGDVETARGLSDDERQSNLLEASEPEESDSDEENTGLMSNKKCDSKLKKSIFKKCVGFTKTTSSSPSEGKNHTGPYIEIPRTGSDDDIFSLDNLNLNEPIRGKQRSKSTNQEKPKRTGGTNNPRSQKQASQQTDQSIKTVTSKVKEENANSSITSEYNLDSARKDLLAAYTCLRHFPNVPTFHYTCHALAHLALNQSQASDKDQSESRTYVPDDTSQWEAAFSLSEGQAITFRNSCLLHISRKLRKLEKSGDTPMNTSETSYITRLQKSVDTLKFAQTRESFQQAVSSIPEDWTVCHVSVLSAMGHDVKVMCVTRYLANKAPFSVTLPGYSTRQGEKLLRDLAEVMVEVKQTLSLTDNVEWWGRRQKLDTKLQEILEAMEQTWLGAWFTILLGCLKTPADKKKLDGAVSKLTESLSGGATPQNRRIIELLLNGGSTLTDHSIISLLSPYLSDPTNTPQVNELVMNIKQQGTRLSLTNASRHPVILILDKDIQHVPWENFPSLRQHPYTRIPSIYFLAAQINYLTSDLNSTLTHGIDPQKIFYILDPDSNLPHTQTKFQSWFESEEGWEGITGRTPDSSTMIKAITQPDLFIYCGHGTGSKYLAGDSVASHDCRAVVLLMGCSSGRLSVEGRFEAHGVMLSYLLGGSPCVMGNLWDVTDRDIDRLFAHFLQSWLQSSKNSNTKVDSKTKEKTMTKEDSCKDLLHHIPASREMCKLPYLIGAATVVYGLPVHIKISK